MSKSQDVEDELAFEAAAELETPVSPPKNVARIVLSWSIKLGVPAIIFIFLFWSGRLKIEELRELARHWKWTLGAMLLFVPAVLVCALRFQLLLGALHIDTRYADNVSLSMIGMLCDLLSPVSNGGDLVKAVYMGRTALTRDGRKPLGLILFAVVIDRIVGMFSLFVLALIVGIAAWPQIEGHADLRRMLAVVILACLAGVLGFMVLVSEKLENSRRRKRLMHILPFHEKLEHIYAGFASLRHHKRTLLTMVGLSLINHLCSCGSILIFAQSMTFTNLSNGAPANLDWAAFVSILPLGLFINSFGFAGGFGVGTLGFDALFRSVLGLKGGAHLALLFQVASLLFRLCGIPFFLFYRHKGVNLAPARGVE